MQLVAKEGPVMKLEFIGVSRILVLMVIGTQISGCLDSGAKTEPNANLAPNITNHTPGISGSPATVVAVDESYSFTPSATDDDSDTLSFAIQNMPIWAQFDEMTGTLAGTPDSSRVGVYTGIEISVSDGNATARLPVFSIEVTQSAGGSVTLTWVAPVDNEDGSTLVNLAGYNIYYGNAPSAYTQSIRLDNPSLTRYVVQNLTPNTYYFVATAINSQGIESSFSNETARMVN